MMNTATLCILILFSLVSYGMDHDGPISVDKCLSCHKDQVSKHDYFQSSHKDVSCTACHVVTESKIRANQKQCAVSFKGVDCIRCHEKISNEHSASVHNSQRLPTNCATCHADIHTIQTHKGDKIAIANKCLECHSQQKVFLKSQHYTGLTKGHQDAASCTDCHGLHAIAKVDNTAKDRVFHTSTCLKCHADKEMMKKNELSTLAADSYFNSFHGKNVRLGYPEKVAGCADCHTAHAVNKADNALASIHSSNIVKTCTQCHAQATALFTKYIAHAEDDDKTKYPSLYWTKKSMTGLLVGTFLFFWLHSLLWMIRTLLEKKLEKPEKPVSKKIYQRFRTGQILLHVMVVVSFLGLSLTGLPLKFSESSWGKFIFNFIGGAEKARLIHHICAVITFTYFVIVLIQSARFLFFNRQQKGTIYQKLFGPDSLFPNKRDLKDFKAMMKWFFFIGPKPTFERWTYWEKFDFLAVFWGMFAIGLSGLMLWFPVLFAQFLPGWVFNLATIVHSDEALLATGFIFTVHFFNTHLRVDKFPMDFVIFDGQLSEHEMQEERGDQWRRYQAEGRLHEFEIQKPKSALWKLIFKIFGFLAVMVGLSLVVGMLVSIF